MSLRVLFITTEFVTVLEQSKITLQQNTVVRAGLCSVSFGVDWHFYAHRSAPWLIDISFLSASRREKHRAPGCGRIRWASEAGTWFVAPPASPMLSVSLHTLFSKQTVENQSELVQSSQFIHTDHLESDAFAQPWRRAEGSGEVSIYVFINAFYSSEPAVAS